MKIFILTGSIAMGKSTVAEFLRQLDIKIFCADEEVHKLYEKTAIIDYVKNYFPKAIINNKIERHKLADYILGNEENRKIIEDLIYKYLEIEKLNFINNYKNENIVILDLPLYFERGQQKYIGNYKIDKVIVVYCSEEKQRFRALQRENLSLQHFENIIKLQLPIEEKIKKADYVINNNGSLKETHQQIMRILQNG